jgi:hypothetical protein
MEEESRSSIEAILLYLVNEQEKKKVVCHCLKRFFFLLLSFTSFILCNTRQHNGMHHFLYPLQTTAAANPALASFGPGIHIKTTFHHTTIKTTKKKLTKHISSER